MVRVHIELCLDARSLPTQRDIHLVRTHEGELSKSIQLAYKGVYKFGGVRWVIVRTQWERRRKRTYAYDGGGGKSLPFCCVRTS